MRARRGKGGADFFPLDLELSAYFSVGEIMEVVTMQSDQAKRLLHLEEANDHNTFERKNISQIASKKDWKKQGTCLIQRGKHENTPIQTKMQFVQFSFTSSLSKPTGCKSSCT